MAKGARTFYPKLFGSKFLITKEIPQAPAPSTDPAKPLDHSPAKAKVNAIMQQAGLPLPVEASTLPATPKLSYTKKQLAEHSQALLDWQNKIDQLNANDPAEWHDHAQAMQTLTFLGEDELKDLWRKYKKHAESLGIGYDSEYHAFYLLERQHQ
ncbi:hypothetical protein [Spirosoma pollinicola]|nr:hypothetical protein [Spirosoma pollinicola]